MKDKYLVVNCGSSSLKFSLYRMPLEEELINGYIEKIGFEDSFLTIKVDGKKISNKRLVVNHVEAVKVMIEELFNSKIISSLEEIQGVGHRILHGGEFYSDSVLIDDEVMNNIQSLIKLGPLHLPGEIAGIEAMKELIPLAKQIAVFDTAFHQTIKEDNYLYAVPYEWYTKYGVRKYGFHGTSHKYITELMKERLHDENVNLIICHVGSGASISCIKNGKCLNTSMGLTPLDGLMMGTRSGNIDESIIKYMVDSGYGDLDLVMNKLNKESGLLGITGKSDFRDVMAMKNNGDLLADLGYKMYYKSIIKYIAEYYFELEGEVSAIIFTAGVLENNTLIREDIIKGLSKVMGLVIESDKNSSIGCGYDYKEGIITKKESKIPVYVIPTNEELMIARDTYRISKEA